MSEQTIQNDLFSNNVTILDKYECLSLGATTIGDLIAGKRIICRKVKTAVKNKGKKPDVLIVDSSRKVIAYIECKKPEAFGGNVADVSMFIRVAVTGKTNAPDLYTVMQILGYDEVIARIDSMLAKI